MPTSRPGCSLGITPKYSRTIVCSWTQLQHGNRLSNHCSRGSLFEQGFAVPAAGSGVAFLNGHLSYSIKKER